jgi:DNA replication licensing factor MCM3
LSIRNIWQSSHAIYFLDKFQPTLSQEAADAIAEEYSRLRSHEVENPDVARTQPVTARALETLIRLSTAHARARLSKVIDADDAHSAIELVQFAYFNRVLEKQRKKKKSDNDDGEEEDEVDTEEEEVI